MQKPFCELNTSGFFYGDGRHDLESTDFSFPTVLGIRSSHPAQDHAKRRSRSIYFRVALRRKFTHRVRTTAFANESAFPDLVFIRRQMRPFAGRDLRPFPGRAFFVFKSLALPPRPLGNMVAKRLLSVIAHAFPVFGARIRVSNMHLFLRLRR